LGFKNYSPAKSESGKTEFTVAGILRDAENFPWRKKGKILQPIKNENIIIRGNGSN